MPKKSDTTKSNNSSTDNEDKLEESLTPSNDIHTEEVEKGILPIEHYVERANKNSKRHLVNSKDSSLDEDDFESDIPSSSETDFEEGEEGYGLETSLINERESEHATTSLVDYFDPNDPVSLYFREVNKVPLLSHDEEIALAKRIEAGRKASSILASETLSNKRKVELRLLIEDGWAAREHLITANFRLVISVAKKYIGRGVPFLDMIQDGNIGLIRATKKFDYRKGYRFSTYATWWIRQAISRGVADHGRTIRLPVHLGDQINRLWRKSHKLTQKLGREATIEEIAEDLDLTPKKVEELMKFSQRPLSLELPSNDDDDNELSDYTPDEIIPPPAETVTEKIMQEHVNEIIQTLPPREARILKLRYGLVDGKSRTLGEVGRKMGVTRERVRQIESQALRRLRQPKLRKQLQDYIRD
jgi:RNA polymerase primary sigma factor